jgi:putative spermidine/putrescine transport system permease protein
VTNAERRKREDRLLALVATCVLIFLISPILAVVGISFTADTTLAFPPSGWSVRWYSVAYDVLFGKSNGLVGTFSTTSRFGSSLITSIWIAIAATSISVFAAVLAAYAVVRYDFPGRAWVEQAFSLPTIYPLIVLGISVLILASSIGFSDGFWKISITHAVITFPFVVRNCISAMRGTSGTLLEAAATLGAPPLRVFFEIVLPIMKPGIISGALLAFMLSFNEFTVAFFLYTVDVVPFSIWLFSQGTQELNPMIFSIAFGSIVFNAILIALMERFSGELGPSV